MSQNLKFDKLRVKKGDTVVVVSGADKGKRGKVLRVVPKKGRVVVENVRMIKKHQRPTQTSPQGGIVEREAPIDISNVMVVDPDKDVPTRVGIRVQEDGTRRRYAKKSGELLDN